MNAKLKLVTPATSPLPAATPRPVLSIVKGLDLDSVKLPKGPRTRKTGHTSAPAMVTASNDDRIPESGRNNKRFPVSDSVMV